MIEKLKTYLQITWDDPQIDARLNVLLEESETAIDGLIGRNLNYNKDLQARELLFSRVRYAYNNAIEIFAENFAAEILRLQLTEGVKKDEE